MYQTSDTLKTPNHQDCMLSLPARCVRSRHHGEPVKLEPDGFSVIWWVPWATNGHHLLQQPSASMASCRVVVRGELYGIVWNSADKFATRSTKKGLNWADLSRTIYNIL